MSIQSELNRRAMQLIKGSPPYADMLVTSAEFESLYASMSKVEKEHSKYPESLEFCGLKVVSA
jgi:hypothetical protein